MSAIIFLLRWCRLEKTPAPGSAWAVLMLIISASQLSAQTNLFFESVTAEGLYTTVIRSIAYVPNGYLYVGTNDGLYKYNGYEFTKYTNSATGELSCPITNIKTIVCNEQYVWLGGLEGLAQLDIHKETFVSIQLQGSSAYQKNPVVKSLYLATQNRLFVGTEGGFYVVNTEKGTQQFFPITGLNSESDYVYANCFTEDSRGNIFIGTQQSGLLYLEYKSGKLSLANSIYSGLSNFPKVVINDMVQSSTGNYLLATSGGIFEIDHSNGNWNPILVSKHDSPLSQPAFKKIQPLNAKGDFLAITQGLGLFQYRATKKTFTNYAYDSRWYNGIADNELNDIESNGDGLFWIATENAGLIKLDYDFERFQYILVPDLNAENSNFSITDIQKLGGYAWLSTSEGLLRFDEKNEFKLFNPVLDEGTGYMQNLIALSDDNLVFQLWGYGVSLFDVKAEAFHFLSFPGSTPWSNEPVFDWLSYVDREGNYYLAGLDGNYYRCNFQKLTTDTLFLESEVQLSLPFVIPIDHDRLIISSGSRLYEYRVSSKSLTPIWEDKNGRKLPPVSFQEDILVRPNGALYMASDEGFFTYDLQDKTLEKFTIKDGLPSNNCFSLFEMPDGRAMIQYDRGYVWYDQENQSFTPYLFPKLVGSSPSPTIDNQRYLYYGADNCYLKVHLDSLTNHPAKPTLRILSVKTGSNTRPSTDSHGPFSLRYQEFPLIIDYELLDFGNLKNNSIQYKLEGWDENWITDDKHNFRAIYSKLTPGDYRFLIRSQNLIDNNTVSREMEFTVNPPYWQTWWFIGILCLLGLAIPFLIYRNRLNQLKNIQLIRNRIAGDLHDDIGSTLSSIRMYSEIVLHQMGERLPESTPLLKKMSENAGEMMESMSDIVWAIKPTNDEFQQLENRMFHSATELCSAHQIQFVMDRNQELERVRIPMEQRRDLFLIFKEALNNAVKYAQCSRLEVRLARQGKKLTMTIQDNGIGISDSNSYPGNGLYNMQNRAEQHGWIYSLDSSPGMGTRINVVMHIP